MTTEFTGYFDDTGKENETLIVGCLGFVATVEQWLRFETDWLTVLRLPQFDLEYFHMKEMRAFKGRFAKFSDNEPLQRDLFDRLQRVIRCRVTNTFAGVVVQPDYWEVNREYMIIETEGPPASLAGKCAIGKLVRWKEQEHPDAELKVVADQGMDHFGMIDNVLYGHTGNRLIPEVVKKSPPLQAADLAGWELQRALTDVLSGKKRTWNELRGSFHALIERLPSPRWFALDASEMRRVFDKVPHLVPKRDASVLPGPV